VQLKINKDKYPFVYNILSNKTIDLSFEKNMWIAGGFARKIGRIILGHEKYDKNTERKIKKYFKGGGDIDAFTDNVSNVNAVFNKSKEDYYYKLSPPDILASSIYDPYRDGPVSSPDFPWESPFANNVDLRQLNATLQLVNKFTFNSIVECLDSFDLANCRYAISKKGNTYYLTYDKNIAEYESNNSIKLCHARTPFLGNRISKYMNKYGLSFNEEKENLNIFEEYLYKMNSNVWKEEIGFDIHDEIIKSTIKTLHKAKNFTPQQLSLFIGKTTVPIFEVIEKNKSTYGIRTFTLIKNVDWASSEISKCANMTQNSL
jgi:hypothetical protein